MAVFRPPLDLGRLHLHVGVLAEVDDRRRVHDVLAVAVALAVVLFDVDDK